MTDIDLHLDLPQDIVKRLRNQARAAAAGPDSHWTSPSVLTEAADEIERLRAIRARYDSLVRANARDNARFSKPKPTPKKNRL